MNKKIIAHSNSKNDLMKTVVICSLILGVSLLARSVVPESTDGYHPLFATFVVLWYLVGKN